MLIVSLKLSIFTSLSSTDLVAEKTCRINDTFALCSVLKHGMADCKRASCGMTSMLNTIVALNTSRKYASEAFAAEDLDLISNRMNKCNNKIQLRDVLLNDVWYMYSTEGSTPVTIKPNTGEINTNLNLSLGNIDVNLTTAVTKTVKVGELTNATSGVNIAVEIGKQNSTAAGTSTVDIGQALANSTGTSTVSIAATPTSGAAPTGNLTVNIECGNGTGTRTLNMMTGTGPGTRTINIGDATPAGGTSINLTNGSMNFGNNEGTFFTSINGSSTTSNYTMILPSAAPTAIGQVLSASTVGSLAQLQWTSTSSAPANPYFLYAYRSSDQTLPAGTGYKRISFNVVSMGSGYNTTTGLYTAQTTGRYLVTLNLTIAAGGALSSQRALHFFKTTPPTITPLTGYGIAFSGNGLAGNGGALCMTSLVNLNAGETLGVALYSTQADIVVGSITEGSLVFQGLSSMTIQQISTL